MSDATAPNQAAPNLASPNRAAPNLASPNQAAPNRAAPNQGARLWIVATPLGNAGDLSPRARMVLETADVVLAEDTRRAGLLFSRLGMQAKRFMSFHEHNEAKKQAGVLRLLADGAQVALISDAGTPVICDPGYRLVRACREACIPVSPVPGPSAPVTALCASGVPPLPYTFLGFMPRRESEIRALFETYGGPGAPPATLIFFERKDRLAATLALATEILGDREVCVGRELTKVHEEFIFLRLAQVRDSSRDQSPSGAAEDQSPAGSAVGQEQSPLPGQLPDELLGELTVVIGPGSSQGDTRERVLEVAAQERAAGGKPKDVARRVHARVRGWSVKQIYELMRDVEAGGHGG